ncbi:MAG: TetR/AcrR family transcriptional regulator [Myxococcales bacterium]|nr:TetR/AcrR family transcriptional regulator [Myxococcales bacterium]
MRESSAAPPGEGDPGALEAGPPARAPAAARRLRILEAAHEVCVEAGLASVRMEAIAARAHVSKGTLYNHFASKEDLLLAMVIERFRAGEQIVDAAIGEPGDPRRALEGLFRGLAGMLAAQTGTAPLLFQAWSLVAYEPRLRQRLDASLREFFRRWSQQTRAILEDGQACGVFDPDADAHALAEAISGLTSGFLFRAAFDPEAANDRTLLAAFHELVAERLLPAAPSPPVTRNDQ